MTILIRGSVGDAVRDLQTNLNTVGVSVDVDGIYGATTEQAVRTFQQGYGIDADGKYGPNTESKLFEAVIAAGGTLSTGGGES